MTDTRQETKRARQTCKNGWGRQQCGWPAVAQLQLGCVHEHIYKTLACAVCTDRVKAGQVTDCYRCARETAPAHRCACIVVVLVDRRGAA